TNEQYNPGVVFPSSLKATYSMKEAVMNADMILLAVPTKAIRSCIQQMIPFIHKKVIITHVSKGIEPDTLLRVSEVIKEEMPEELIDEIVVLSGPSHAEEVSKRLPTTITASAKNSEKAEFVQDLFMNNRFRVYTNPDVVGVELGGALKNIIALGAGISDGLGYGDNAKAALITRGLAEITRLGTKLGANPITFAGLTGLGDLIVTCTSIHSRNYRAGYELGKGRHLKEVLDSVGMVVEGVRTTKAAFQLSEIHQVDMPITQEIYKVLFADKNPKEAVDDLMTRMKRSEMENLYDSTLLQ
ncbi:MAG TPA: NAD(P)H-dependent glycerol-3-phosphate dehydrogenase, partial [Massilibacterium sp.]|nr:NAD(P)H-dependent glycerol-3-phosphate dehydrogenase [Massilibacterium sp.]